jgi:Ctr copper transporter family.
MCFFAPGINWYKKHRILKAEASSTGSTTGDIEKGNSMETRIKLTILFFFQSILGAAIMLLLMTFNYWVIASTILGLAIGYYTFESKTADAKSKAGGACC